MTASQWWRTFATGLAISSLLTCLALGIGTYASRMPILISSPPPPLGRIVPDACLATAMMMGTFLLFTALPSALTSRPLERLAVGLALFTLVVARGRLIETAIAIPFRGWLIDAALAGLALLAGDALMRGRLGAGRLITCSVVLAITLVACAAARESSAVAVGFLGLASFVVCAPVLVGWCRVPVAAH